MLNILNRDHPDLLTDYFDGKPNEIYNEILTKDKFMEIIDTFCNKKNKLKFSKFIDTFFNMIEYKKDGEIISPIWKEYIRQQKNNTNEPVITIKMIKDFYKEKNNCEQRGKGK
jgi:cell division FtsZ-interacting protein ZapD